MATRRMYPQMPPTWTIEVRGMLWTPVSRILPSLAALSFGLLVAKAALALDVPHLAATVKPSVVLVTLYDDRGTKLGSGSGFFISADGKLVTNHHVIEGAAKATVSMSDGREIAVLRILADDPAHDIAVIQVEGGGYSPLPIGDTSALHVGDDIVVVGSPLGLSTTVSSGIVAAVREEGLSKESRFDSEDDKKMVAAWGLQITAPVSHGSSGSPILNGAGEVVGVAVAVLGEGENINFGVPTVFVKAAIARAQAGTGTKLLGEDTSDRKKNLGISAGLALLAYLVYVIVTRIQRRRASGPRRDLRGLRH
jgi:S1-C subfamily serine protease